jgi:organic hydroperoxide reductase OsmC/OhrA
VAEVSETTVETPAYVSKVHVRRLGGLDKAVTLPAEPDEKIMGGHTVIAEHYKAPADRESHASTLDYVVGACTACLAGTFATCMRVREVVLDLDDYEVEGAGDLFVRDGVLVIERIVVTHRVRLPEEHHALAQRVLGFYERNCAVSRSIEGAIEIESRLEFV